MFSGGKDLSKRGACVGRGFSACAKAARRPLRAAPISARRYVRPSAPRRIAALPAALPRGGRSAEPRHGLRGRSAVQFAFPHCAKRCGIRSAPRRIARKDAASAPRRAAFPRGGMCVRPRCRISARRYAATDTAVQSVSRLSRRGPSRCSESAAALFFGTGISSDECRRSWTPSRRRSSGR